MWFSPLPCYLVHLRPKYSSQHPVLKHPQPTFPPQCERPSFTHNGQNYGSVYLIVNTGENQKVKGKIHLTALIELTVSNFTYHFST